MADEGTLSLKTRTASLRCASGPVAGGAGRGVAADDVIIQHGFERPALVFGELGEVGGAGEALLFAADDGEDDRAGELELAERAGALEADGDAAPIVVGTGRVGGGVHHVVDARVDVAGDERPGGFRVGAVQDRVDIAQAGFARVAVGALTGGGGLGGEAVLRHLKTAAACRADAAVFGVGPVHGGVDAVAGGQPGFHAAEGGARTKAHQRVDVGLHLRGADRGEGGGDARVGRLRGERLIAALGRERCGGQHTDRRSYEKSHAVKPPRAGAHPNGHKSCPRRPIRCRLFRPRVMFRM